MAESPVPRMERPGFILSLAGSILILSAGLLIVSLVAPVGLVFLSRPGEGWRGALFLLYGLFAALMGLLALAGALLLHRKKQVRGGVLLVVSAVASLVAGGGLLVGLVLGLLGGLRGLRWLKREGSAGVPSARRLALLAMAALVVALLFGGGLRRGLEAGTGTEARTLEHDGLLRLYHLHVPPVYDGSRMVPLVLVLHGAGSDGPGTYLLTLGGWNRLSDREGFLLAYPDGIGNRWNDGRSEDGPRGSKADDVGFLTALVERLSRDYRVDPARIYVTGISNGAFMSHRLACDTAWAAAIAPVAGQLSEDTARACSPRGPMPVLSIGGTRDSLVPWQGGEVSVGRRRLGRIHSAAETTRFWVDKNGCPPAPRMEDLPDRDPGDGTRVQVESYGPCRNNSEVVQYRVEGGGHTWPGGLQYLPEWLAVGRTSRDMDATEVIWEFFQRHPRAG